MYGIAQRVAAHLGAFRLFLPDISALRMPEQTKVLFLYAHVQPFLLAGINRLIQDYNAEVLVVCWPKTEMAPTATNESERLRFLYKDANNKQEVESCIKAFDPEVVYVVGWMDKDYLRWAKQLKRSGKRTIMAMDTQWRNTIKQRVNCLLSRFTLKPIFDYAWVPGPSQKEYAERLGFDESHVLDKVYATDTDLFVRAYEQSQPVKRQHFPKTFLYAGRLVPHKFEPLLNAFAALSEQQRAGWKLIVAGKGPMEQDTRMGSEAIIYQGFLQQDQLVKLVADAGVFCLLSTEEPWGMVIQEFAAGGLPILASKQCGASQVYVKEGQNGYIVDGAKTEQIQDALLKIINTDTKQLLAMGERSTQIAAGDNSDLWAKTLMSVIS